MSGALKAGVLGALLFTAAPWSGQRGGAGEGSVVVASAPGGGC